MSAIYFVLNYRTVFYFTWLYSCYGSFADVAVVLFDFISKTNLLNDIMLQLVADLFTHYSQTKSFE